MTRDFSSTRWLISTIGGNLQPQENRKAWFNRVAQAAGLHYRLVRAAWYGERLSFETQSKLRLAAERNENERRSAAVRFESFARYMEEKYPGVYGAEADAFSDLARRIRALDGEG